MISISEELAELLGTVRQAGDFFAFGRIAVSLPRMEVDGVGPVAFPLLPVQAERLIAAATRAPYGRGEATLVDTSVRRTWQIGADRVRLEGKHWAQTLETIVGRSTESLGVTGGVKAELYKLLIYDEGSFFVSRRDTEKVPGMFATLVIMLPSVSAGGELVVRHKGREVKLDLCCEDPSEVAFAFYADCVHEVLPVTSGCRLALVYNLVRAGTASRAAARSGGISASRRQLPCRGAGFVRRRKTNGMRLAAHVKVVAPRPAKGEPPEAHALAIKALKSLKGVDGGGARHLCPLEAAAMRGGRPAVRHRGRHRNVVVPDLDASNGSAGMNVHST